MKWGPEEGLENEDIEGTPEKLEAGFLHAELLPLEFMGRMACFPLVAQGKSKVQSGTSVQNLRKASCSVLHSEGDPTSR
jgi:hypothetical protein